jgi:hypothetical protein
VIGSSVFFHVPEDGNLHMRLPGGVEAWAGYRQAVKPCQFGLSFNIDLAATAFLTSGRMTDVLASVSRTVQSCVSFPAIGSCTVLTLGSCTVFSQCVSHCPEFCTVLM